AIGTAVLPMLDLIAPAAAQTATDEAPTDVSIVAFAESVEQALFVSYSEAATLGPASAAAVKVALTTFAGHHQQHGASFGNLANMLLEGSTNRPNPKLHDVARVQFRAVRDQNHILDVGVLLLRARA